MTQEEHTAPVWLQLVLQDAILTSPIPPQVRGIALGYSRSRKPIFNVYYDQEPTEDERELMRSILTEYCVEPRLGPEDLPVEVNFSTANVPPSELERLDDFLYLIRD